MATLSSIKTYAGELLDETAQQRLIDIRVRRRMI
jgi:hypothetical protein